MPPKRPRIEPSQTKISVQDVRDYSTPQGAAMANEEMRRIQLALEQVQQPQVVAAAGVTEAPAPAQQAGGDTYSLTVANRANADAQDKIIANVRDLRFDDQGKPKGTISVNFEVADLGSGIAQVRAFVPSQRATVRLGGVSYTEIDTFTFADTTTVIWNVQQVVSGNVAISAISPLQIQQSDVNVGDNLTTALNFENASPTKPAAYTDPLWFDVADDGSGKRTITAWYSGGSGSAYSWYLQAEAGPTEEIGNGETVTFTGTGSTTVTRVGNTINIDVPVGGYNWKASDGGAADTIASGETVTWKGASGGGISVAYTAATNTFNFTNVSYWRMTPDTGLTVQIFHDDTLNVQGINGVTTSSTVPFPKELVIDRPLQLQQSNVNVGDQGTTIIDFYNATPTLPAGYTSNIFFEVTDLGAGERQIKGWYEDTSGSGAYDWTASDGTTSEVIANGDVVNWVGGTDIDVTYDAPTNTFTIDNTYEYHFFIQASSGTTERIDSGETVNFTGTGAATVTRSGNTINVDVPVGGYSWTASDGVDNYSVGNANTVIWQGDGAVDVDLVGSTFTIYRPLTIEDDNAAVGGSDVEYINFDSQGEFSTSQPVNFLVVNDGAGQRTVRAYVPTGGTYGWNIQANGTATTAVGDGATVNFHSSDGTVDISLVQTGLSVAVDDIDLSRPLTIEDDDVAVGGVDTFFLNFDSQSSTSMGQAVNFEVVDDGAGQRTVRGWVPASAGTYEWIASDGTNTETVDNTETIKWLGGTNITVSLDTVTKAFTISADPYPVYYWNLAASGTAGTEQIDSGETVTFVGTDGIEVTRSGATVTIGIDEIDPPWDPGSQPKRRMAGEIVFTAGDPDDFGAPPDYYYGVRRYVDIVHNWALSSLNNFHLELVDKHLELDIVTNTMVLSHTRNTETYPTAIGPLGSAVRYRNLPHWAAIDRDTVRVWATMTEEDATDMVFRYVLTEE